jgi:hypothetical protein
MSVAVGLSLALLGLLIIAVNGVRYFTLPHLVGSFYVLLGLLVSTTRYELVLLYFILFWSFVFVQREAYKAFTIFPTFVRERTAMAVEVKHLIVRFTTPRLVLLLFVWFGYMLSLDRFFLMVRWQRFSSIVFIILMMTYLLRINYRRNTL